MQKARTHDHDHHDDVHDYVCQVDTGDYGDDGRDDRHYDDEDYAGDYGDDDDSH